MSDTLKGKTIGGLIRGGDGDGDWSGVRGVEYGLVGSW
jgi:hypothetical protein